MESPVPDTPEKLVKKHIGNMVKRCPHPLCGSTEAIILLCFDNSNLEQPRYLCKGCKREFTFEGRYLVYYEEPTCVRWLRKEAGLKALTNTEQYVMRRISEEVDAKALTFLRRIGKEAAAKALTAVHKEAGSKELTAEKHTEVIGMHMEAAAKAMMAEELRAVLRMHKEAAAMASAYVRWMRKVGEEAAAKELMANHVMHALKLDEEGADKAFAAAKAKYALKLGNLTSQQNAAKELSSKGGGTGRGRAGIHFEPVARDQRESGTAEKSQETFLNLDLCLCHILL